MNTMMHTDARKNNRGFVETVNAEEFEQTLKSENLKQLVSRIRNGEEKLKDRLPWVAVHYFQFFDNKRDQAHANKYAFTHRSCLDDDDPATVEQAFKRARELNDDPDSLWHGLIERLSYSARKKGHIDFRLPVGMTIEEAQQQLASDLGIEHDKSVCSPERFIYQTAEDDVVWQSDKFYEIVDYAEQKLREAAYQRRGLDVDGRPLQGPNVPDKLREQFTPQPAKQAPKPQAGARPQDDGDEDELFHQAEAVAGVRLKDAPEGERHETLKRLLSRSGLAQAVRREEIISWVADTAPEWYRQDRQDIENLVRDFADKYRDTPVRVSTDKADAPDTKAGKTTAYVSHARHDDYYDPALLHPSKMATGMRESMAAVPPELRLPLLVGLEPCIGAEMCQVKAENHTGAVDCCRGMAVITGDPASGKSQIRRVVDIWMRPLREVSRKAHEKREEWDAKRRTRKATEALPPEPKDVMREVPFTISISALIRVLKNAGDQIIYSFDDEAATMAQTNSAGAWSDKTVAYTKAFDGEMFGQEYQSAEAVSGMVAMNYNWTLLSQPAVTRRLFANPAYVSQGISSRIMYARMPQEKFARLEKLIPIPARAEAAIEATARKLMALPAGTLAMTKITRALERRVEEVRQEAEANDDLVLDFVRKRCAVKAWRIGMMLHQLRLLDGGTGVSQTTVEQTLYLYDYLMDCELELLGTSVARSFAPAADYEGIATQKSESARLSDQLLDELPDTFSRQDLAQLRPEMKDSSLRSQLSRWMKGGKIRKTAKGYQKTQAEG